MKFGFLNTKVSIVVIGLIVGSTVGFKIANIQFRSEQGVVKRNAVAAAAGQFSQSTNPGNTPNLTPEQREQINNQVRETIEKAKANPQDLDAQLDAAAQYIQINQPQEAIPFLEQARKANPGDARALVGFGVVKMMMGLFDEGVKYAKQARELEPNNSQVAMLLFMAYLETKNITEAEKLLRELEASGLDPQRLAQMRKDLDSARSGGSSGSPNTGSRSTLDHGPQDQQPGGKR
jgi:tetratricopeptide (TPR) repeat protein